MLQLTRAAVTVDLASEVDCNIGNHFFADEFLTRDVDISNFFASAIKPNNQSLHSGEKQAYISNHFCSRVTETKSVTITPGLP